jgi:hypothetical protein
MCCLMIDGGAPPLETAKGGRGAAVSAYAGADAGAGVLAVRGVGGAAFEPLHQGGDGQDRRIGDQQVQMVSPLNSMKSTSCSSQTVRMVCAQKVSMSSVNTGRRCLVTNTVWACRWVAGAASGRLRSPSRGGRLGGSRVPVSVRRVHPHMCGRGRCAQILGSCARLGPGSSLAPGCITRCSVSSSHGAVR